MLRSTKKLRGYNLIATDGMIGRVYEFYFDNYEWAIRYFVVDTGKWLPGRKVLISPVVFGQPDWKSKRIPVNLTKMRIENAPPVSKDEPVSRQKEIDINAYFGWANYWSRFGAPDLAPVVKHPEALRIAEEEAREGLAGNRVHEGDPNLRSTREVINYNVRASDGEIGHIEDYIVDDKTWVVRYLVIDTRNLLPGKKVIVSPNWIEDIRWARREVRFNVARDFIENAPEFNPSEPINREYETVLYDYYGRPQEWL